MESLNGQNTSTFIEDISAPEIIISGALIFLTLKSYEWTKVALTLLVIAVFAFLLNLSKSILILIDVLSAALMITTGLLLYQEFMENLNVREKLTEQTGAHERIAPDWSSVLKGLLAVSLISSSAYFIARLGSR